MAVENAEQIIPVINNLRKNKELFNYVFLARDWHPPDHVSFQSNNPGTEVFDQIIDKKTGEEIIMWPDHCI